MIFKQFNLIIYFITYYFITYQLDIESTLVMRVAGVLSEQRC